MSAFGVPHTLSFQPKQNIKPIQFQVLNPIYSITPIQITNTLSFQKPITNNNQNAYLNSSQANNQNLSIGNNMEKLLYTKKIYGLSGEEIQIQVTNKHYYLEISGSLDIKLNPEEIYNLSTNRINKNKNSNNITLKILPITFKVEDGLNFFVRNLQVFNLSSSSSSIDYSKLLHKNKNKLIDVIDESGFDKLLEQIPHPISNISLSPSPTPSTKVTNNQTGLLPPTNTTIKIQQTREPESVGILSSIANFFKDKKKLALKKEVK
jgi:hypothetical protein